jgi:hypothetical protein
MFFFSVSKSRAMRPSCSSTGLLALGDAAPLGDAALLALEDEAAANENQF